MTNTSSGRTAWTRGAKDQAARAALDEAAAATASCTACSLHENRTRCVFGTGHAAARLLWLGEAPGPEEDLRGEPFTGRSGELLTRIIEALGAERGDVFLANTVSCRLDDDRRLGKKQIEACRDRVEAQIAAVDPEVIVALGSTAWNWFRPDDKRKMADVRGTVYRWRTRLVVPTYHPAFLLRMPAFKRDVWEDVQRAKALLAESIDASKISFETIPPHAGSRPGSGTMDPFA